MMVDMVEVVNRAAAVVVDGVAEAVMEGERRKKKRVGGSVRDCAVCVAH